MQPHTTPDGPLTVISVEYLGPLLEFLAQQGISSAQLVQGTDLPVRALTSTGGGFTALQYDRIIQNAVQLSGDPLLGLEHGRRMSIASHGFLGFAVMASDTLGQGLSLAIRYASTRTRLADIRFLTEGDYAIIQLSRRAALPRTFGYIAHSILSTFVTIARFLTRDQGGSDAIVCFTEDAQQPEAYYRHILGCDVAFAQEHYQVRIPKAMLELPVSTANNYARMVAERECERLLAATSPETLDMASRVRLLLESEGCHLQLPAIAATLSTSERTLNRQLAQLNTSLRQLSEEVRKERACQLLSSSSAKIEQIAAELSYNDTSNFVRAFRRWMGMTPLAFRKMTKSVG